MLDQLVGGIAMEILIARGAVKQGRKIRKYLMIYEDEDQKILTIIKHPLVQREQS